jgi:transposase
MKICPALMRYKIGIVSENFWSSTYKSLAKEHDEIVLAYCWAHVRRDFLSAARSWPGLAPWMWKWIEDIRTLYRLNTARLAVWDTTMPFDQQPSAWSNGMAT